MSVPSIAEPIRILMADDEALFLESTADLLRREGYLVDTASDGFQAASLLQERVYDFLISDLAMPGNRDMSLLKEAAESRPGLGMIVVTGYPSVTTARESVQLPVLAYLVKPIDMEELLGHLQRGAASVRIQRTLGQSRDRMLGWVDEMARMQDLMRQAPRPIDPGSTRTILGLTLGNMSALLLDMKEIFDQSLSQGAASEFCSVSNCPRLQAHQEGVADAIEVLERTKHAFKSKDLAQLRERLERLQGSARG